MQKISVIGGGAAGLACAVFLARAGKRVCVLERGERVGRKLSATGNGQGNVTNLRMDSSHYFSDDLPKVARILHAFPAQDTVAFLSSMGGIFVPDERGRVYPASRQASAVTDLFRRELARLGAEVRCGVRVKHIAKGETFLLEWEGGSMTADKVILAAGGCAGPNFGTDGDGYLLARELGHSVTPLAPALGKLRCDPALVRGLKGIRMDAALRVLRGGKALFETRGDVLFADGGVSGDAVFRASSYAKEGDVLSVDLLPGTDEETLRGALSHGENEDMLLCVVPNGLARVLYRRAAGDRGTLISLIKDFRLPVTGDFGFAGAQVTKGGVPLSEVTDSLESKKAAGLFLAGEVLNADGECGGYNLQWAFASAHAAAEGALS